VQDIVTKLNDPLTGYAYFEDSGFLFWFADEAGLDFVYHSDSILGRQVSLVLRHTELFRSVARLTLNAIVFVNKEAASRSAVEHLYANRDADLLPVSSAIRYSIIAGSLEYRDEAVLEASRVSFRVE